MQEEYVSHVSRDPIRPAHMIIQQKILWLAAYEGHVLEICGLDTKQQLALVHNNM